MADADTKQAKDTEEEKPAGKKSGGFIPQVLTAVVAGAAAFGTVFFLPEDTAAEAPVCEMTEQPQEKEEAKIEEPSLEDITFVQLEPLVLSLGQAAEARLLKIGLTLETPYGYEYDIEYAEPKLRDAFTGYLRALEMDYLEDPASMVRLRAQLLRRAEVVLGPEAVHGVLITDFLVR